MSFYRERVFSIFGCFAFCNAPIFFVACEQMGRRNHRRLGPSYLPHCFCRPLGQKEKFLFLLRPAACAYRGQFFCERRRHEQSFYPLRFCPFPPLDLGVLGRGHFSLCPVLSAHAFFHALQKTLSLDRGLSFAAPCRVHCRCVLFAKFLGRHSTIRPLCRFPIDVRRPLFRPKRTGYQSVASYAALFFVLLVALLVLSEGDLDLSGGDLSLSPSKTAPYRYSSE